MGRLPCCSSPTLTIPTTSPPPNSVIYQHEACHSRWSTHWPTWWTSLGEPFFQPSYTRLSVRAFFFFFPTGRDVGCVVAHYGDSLDGARITSGGTYVEENEWVVQCARCSIPLPDDGKQTVLDKGRLSSGRAGWGHRAARDEPCPRREHRRRYS